MSQTSVRNPAVDSDWEDFKSLWNIRPDSIYLNHGSFGPPPVPVQESKFAYSRELDSQPMDFYLRHYEPLLENARQKLAEFVGTDYKNLIFVENATFGMNVVAESFQLKAGDEVLLNNHEYGAVHRIWHRTANAVGAKVVSAQLPERIESRQQIVDCFLSEVTVNTKLIVVSHITSPTALIMPVKEICAAMRARGIAVCIDGPHAPAQIELNIGEIDCDFYTASCHKWLCASLGSGFLFAHSRHHASMQPPLKSWGRLLPAMPEHWTEEFIWSGTRDPAAYLSIPAAIEFMNQIGLENFRERSYWLAKYGEERLCELTGEQTIASRMHGWYGSMAHIRLPVGNHENLQRRVWDDAKIEVPIFEFEGRDYVRLSCHLYNDTEQIDQLVTALSKLM